MAAKNDGRPFRHILRDRILIEMLRAAKEAGSQGKSGGANWKVLITDAFTLRVISSSCKMPDVTEEGISLVEDIAKRRQPQPFMEALYFIEPSQLSLSLFKNDMQGREPLYKRAHVFFSRPLPRDFLQTVKEDPQLRSRIAALREMNLEVLTVDVQGFVTDHPDALQTLFGHEINGRAYERTLHDMAARIATVFASLNEFPMIRYKAAKVSSGAPGSAERMRDMVPSKLAAVLWEKVQKYKAELQGYPQRDTCDLLIVDRTLDPIAPLIRDWSYGGICFDLLPMDGNKYEYETAGKDGKREKKAALIDEHDPVWLQLRDLFLPHALTNVSSMFKDVSAKMSTKKELTGSQLTELVRNIPNLTELKEKLELHIKICSSINEKVNQEGLQEVGELEQGFVFGDKDADYKKLSSILKDNEDAMSPYSKLRLLLVYAATHPEKLDAKNLEFWSNLACLGPADMQSLLNLEMLGVPLGATSSSSSSSSFSLSFGGRKGGKGGPLRKERKEEEYKVNRFYPVVQDVLEDMHTGSLSFQDYPSVSEPSSQGGSGSLAPSASPSPIASKLTTSIRSSSSTSSASAPVKEAESSKIAGEDKGGSVATGKVLSVRKKPTHQRSESASSSGNVSSGNLGASGSSLASWALKGKDGSASDRSLSPTSSTSSSSSTVGGGSVRGSSVRGGSGSIVSGTSNLSLSGSSGSMSGSSSRGRPARRLFVFVIGGMTRSEIRVAHTLSEQLKREVIIGSSSLDSPLEFVEKLKLLKKR